MQRLKTRPQFQAVLAGKLVAKTPHFALHKTDISPVSAGAGVSGETTGGRLRSLFPVMTPWMGAMVPKRWAKRAVTRNTIKRQIYSVSSGLKSNFPQAAFLVRLRCEYSRKDYSSASSTALKEAVRIELLDLMHVFCTASMPRHV